MTCHIPLPMPQAWLFRVLGNNRQQLPVHAVRRALEPELDDYFTHPAGPSNRDSDYGKLRGGWSLQLELLVHLPFPFLKHLDIRIEAIRETVIEQLIRNELFEK
ncbi:MAG TPA: hypothetical protein VIX37_09010 [Candidatus Sulfotelmatobacter sp.]